MLSLCIGYVDAETLTAFCGVDSNATTPQIIAAFRVKFRLNRQKLAKNENAKTATR